MGYYDTTNGKSVLQVREFLHAVIAVLAIDIFHKSAIILPETGLSCNS
jgi:hypothetical protein